MGDRVVQQVRVWSMACPNPDCELVGVEVEAPSKIAISGHLATRPQYVCLACEWDLQRLPDRPWQLRLTDLEADHLHRVLDDAIDRDVDGSDLDHATLLRLRLMVCPHGG